MPVSERDVKFAATVLSVVAAAKGEPKQYACKMANIKVVLNNYLDPKKRMALACHAGLVESLLASTACKNLLKGTIGKVIAWAKDSYGRPPHYHHAISIDSVEGRLLKKLVPEVYDGAKRDILVSLGTLPTWAQ
jgi:hypothetical protein